MAAPEIRLVDVRTAPQAVELLWTLLAERPAEANISHRAMPTREQHAAFVARHPYRCWFLVQAGREFVGACYLTQHNEVGVGVLRAFQRRGFARAALQELLRMHQPLPAVPGERRGSFIANVAPGNAASQRLFEGLGGRLVQQTYDLSGAKRG